MKRFASLRWVFATVLLQVVAGAPLCAQAPAIKTLEQLFCQYQQTTLQEKLYLHTDKEVYLAGETVWFRVYNVDASGHQPLDLSKVAYVEVLDQAQQPVLQTKIALQQGSGHGTLSLPPALGTGPFQLRAYTNWMKNSDPDFFFRKPLPVVNTLLEPESLAAADLPAPAYDIQFFPEGGHLVAGVAGKVAFRAVDRQGHGIPCTGMVVDQQTAQVASFTSLKFGIGSFSFTPQPGQQYRAVITTPDGEVQVRQLPEVAERGYALQVTPLPDQRLRVRVQAAGTGSRLVYLLAHTRQQLKVLRQAPLQNNQAEFALEASALGEGISHLTIFDERQQPVAERLYFVRPRQQLVITASTDQAQYPPRHPVTLQLATATEQGAATPADLSVAVYCADSVAGGAADIAAYLWLSSDLRGTVEAPGYYFQAPTAETDLALDNLLLTHGWRRFAWEQVLRAEPLKVAYLPEYEGHLVQASLTHKNSREPVAGVMGYLAVPGRRFHLYGAPSDPQGQLRFLTKDVVGPQELVLQTDSPQDSLLQMLVASPFSEAPSSFAPAAWQLSESHRETLLSQSVSLQVQSNFASGTTQRFGPVSPDSSVFYGQPPKRYLLDDYTRFPTLQEVIKEYVSEVATQRRAQQTLYRVLQPDRTEFLDQPLMLLDGVPLLHDTQKIGPFDARQVQALEVVPYRYHLGPLVFNGIISLRTYRGNLGGFPLNPHALIVNYEGLQRQREFFSPVYETATQRASRQPDFRNLLYWSPQVLTQNAKQTHLRFFTSDQEGRYVVVVQGLSSDGRAGSRTFTFDVLPPR